MKRNIFLAIAVVVACVGFAFHAKAQATCPAGQECAWINVSSVTSFGVSPSASSQQFYNDGATKDHLCQLSGYQSNPGYSWAIQQSKWNKCNAEYHVTWNGFWDSHRCGGDSYLTAVYCVRTPAPVAAPEVSISVSPQSVQTFGHTTITWSSQNADSCQASGDWSGDKGTSGSEESGMFGFSDKTFDITCTGKGGTAQASASADIYIIPSAPTVSWQSAPANAASGETYCISAAGSDSDGDLSSVTITKDGAYYTSASGQGAVASRCVSDIGPKTVTFKATAVDSKSNGSTEISHTVTIAAPPTSQNGNTTTPTTGPAITITPISASVSASPSCVAPGGTITVSGSASGGDKSSGGSIITSNNLEKDSNKDNSFGVIASRSDAGTNSATVSVPSSETSDRYDFRTAVNGEVYSSVASVTISASCGGAPASCPWYYFGNCSGSQPTNNPPVSTPPSVSISANSSCVPPNSTVYITSNANGSPITSNVIQKDSPAENSQYGDTQFGTISDYGSSGGSHTLATSVGREGYYDFKALVNNSVSATTRVHSLASCAAPSAPANNPFGPAGGGNPPPLPACTGGKVRFGNGPCSCPAGQVDINGFCVTPGFTVGATVSPVAIQVLPVVGGTSRATSIWIGPTGQYARPITLSASLASDFKTVEYSWNGGAFSPNATYQVLSFNQAYPNTTLIIRVTGTTAQDTHTVTVTGRGNDGKTAQSSFQLQINKRDQNFTEE